MPPSRFGPCLFLALLSVLASAPAARAESTASAVGTPAGSEAAIVLVGAAGRDPELRALLSELLERRGVRTRISQQSAFSREQLLGAATTGDSVQVFVVPGLSGGVGLYFRAPDGQRFLLRSVLLRAGFDDVGRELVGQIVETAVASLLHSGDGLTREQAQLALTSEEPSAVRPEPTKAPETPAPARPRSTQEREAPRRRTGPTGALEGWFALRYGALALGAPLGVAHGPGLELGLGLKRRFLLRGRVTAERDFPQSFETSLIAARLARVRLGLAADAGLPLTTRHMLLVSLGIGQDRLHVTPSAPTGSTVAPAPAFPADAPVAHAELRYEAALGSFRLAAALGADASLLDTHYDLARGGERQRVVQPWRLRPSSSIALAFCPVWATF